MTGSYHRSMIMYHQEQLTSELHSLPKFDFLEILVVGIPALCWEPLWYHTCGSCLLLSTGPHSWLPRIKRNFPHSSCSNYQQSTNYANGKYCGQYEHETVTVVL